MVSTVSYSITYTVIASSNLEAVGMAVRLLRTDVKLLRLGKIDGKDGLWTVQLFVSEKVNG